MKVYGPDNCGMVQIQCDEEEWEEIQEKLKWCDALDAAGVDNWDGIDYAQDLLRKMQ